MTRQMARRQTPPVNRVLDVGERLLALLSAIAVAFVFAYPALSVGLRTGHVVPFLLGVVFLAIAGGLLRAAWRPSRWA